jgi:hypothetical protein
MIKQLLLTLILFVFAGTAFTQDIPQIEDLNIDSTLADTQTAFDNLPDQLDEELLPAETATQFFGYIKWIFANSDELVGATLAPILNSLYVILFTSFTFTTMWLTIRMLVLGWRLMLFIFEWVIRLLELIPFFQ